MDDKKLAGALIGLAMVCAMPKASAGYLDIMDKIITEKDAEVCEHDYSRAIALISVKEWRNGTTKVVVRVWNAKPNHIYTMWLKIDGTSSITGIGATPAVGAADIQNVIDSSGTQSASADNAFYTNSRGNGRLEVWLDFHLSDDIYPFSEYDPSFADKPIGDTPFTFRVISHCTDDLQHGLYPGTHEPTFQISY